MGGKIDAYVDCASPYSYFALVYLRKQRDLLAQYGIEIEFHPVFLGGINHATGNKPPSTLPAKGAYGSYDLRRACTHFGTPRLSSPPFFPLVSLLPQRAMVAIKSLYPSERYEVIYNNLWLAVFERHIDIAKPDELVRVLTAAGLSDNETKKVLDMAQAKEYKDQLTANTKTALERGAFGAPWFWLKNDQGQEEPMFGSDRWSYMFRFLGVEVEELRIVEKSSKAISGDARARL